MVVKLYNRKDSLDPPPPFTKFKEVCEDIIYIKEFCLHLLRPPRAHIHVYFINCKTLDPHNYPTYSQIVCITHVEIY